MKTDDSAATITDALSDLPGTEDVVVDRRSGHVKHCSECGHVLMTGHYPSCGATKKRSDTGQHRSPAS